MDFRYLVKTLNHTSRQTTFIALLKLSSFVGSHLVDNNESDLQFLQENQLYNVHWTIIYKDRSSKFAALHMATKWPQVQYQQIKQNFAGGHRRLRPFGHKEAIGPLFLSFTSHVINISKRKKKQ